MEKALSAEEVKEFAGKIERIATANGMMQMLDHLMAAAQIDRNAKAQIAEAVVAEAWVKDALKDAKLDALLHRWNALTMDALDRPASPERMK